MKKLKLILCSFIYIFLLGACDENDFLTARNINSPDADDFIKDNVTAEATVFAIYGGLQYNGVCGGTAANVFAGMSVLAKAPHYALTNGTGVANTLTFSSNDGFVTQSYRDLFSIVGRANITIQGINNLPAGASITEQERKVFLGEAHFLRALAYFWLNNTYKEVPLILEPATTFDETLVDASNIQDASAIYEQIENDFKIAQKYLPLNKKDRIVKSDNGDDLLIEMWPSNYKGRATWGAATAYLGKTYLYQNKNSDARIEFEKVVAGDYADEYSLVPDYYDNSNIAGEWNDESIFEVGFAQQPVVTNGNFGGGEGNSLNETTTRGFLFNWQEGGWGSSHSTNFITELMKSDIVDPTNSINYKDGDVNNDSPQNFTGFSRRCKATIAFNGDGELFYTKDLSPGSPTNTLGFTTSQSRFRKFTNWQLAREPGQAVSEINERLMRLADVYLMYAEAILKEQGDAGAPIAVEYINRVRARAGVTDLENLFNIEIEETPGMLRPRNYLETIALDKADKTVILSNRNTVKNPTEVEPRDINSAVDLLNHLFNEERIQELALEGRGITWQDTRRRPNLSQWIDQVNQTNYVTNDVKEEFRGGAEALMNDPQAGLFDRPSIETIALPNN